jgi:hypothetical protein
MNEPLIVLIYSFKADYQPLLEWQLKRAGLETHHVVDPDFSWRRRQLLTRDVAAQNPDRLLIYPDAWDTVLLGTKDEILRLPLEGSVTVAGAKVCWPDPRQEDYARKYEASLVDKVWRTPKPISLWRYVNSNPLAGLGRDIARAIDWGWERFPLKGDSSDVRVEDGEVCERFWTSLFLDGPKDLHMRIDSGCYLNQTWLCIEPEDYLIARTRTNEPNRLMNRKTGSWPIFLHLNGKHLLPDGLVEL